MRHVFAFTDDYTKVTYGLRDTLKLIRKDDNDALFRTAVAGAGKLVLSKLALVVPIVQPNDVLKVNLYKSIAATIPVRFRSRQCETFTLPQARSTVWRLGVSSALEKPRRVLVGLQTGKSGNQERNAAIFDHFNLTNMQVCLNHSRYPTAGTATDFVMEQYLGVYKKKVIEAPISTSQYCRRHFNSVSVANGSRRKGAGSTWRGIDYTRVATGPGKSWKVLDFERCPGKSWKVLEFSKF